MSVEISLMYEENNKGPRTVTCGTPDKNGALSEFGPFTTAQKRICPFQCLPTYATAKQFALKELMRLGVSKSNMKVSTCTPLSKILAQSCITVVS